jgi:cytochrome c oxidase subunit 3
MFMSGIGFYFHRISGSGYVLILGSVCVAYCAFGRFSDIVDEATNKGYHTCVVRKGSRLGPILLVVSETMLFFGSFWAFSDTTSSPDATVGYMAPPPGIEPIHAIGIPSLNTMLLLLSGLSIT